MEAVEIHEGELNRIIPEIMEKRIKSGDTSELWIRYDEAVNIINTGNVPPVMQGSEP